MFIIGSEIVERSPPKSNGIIFNQEESIFLLFGRPSSGQHVSIMASYDSETRISNVLAYLNHRASAAVVSTGHAGAMIVGGWVGGKCYSSVEMFSFKKRLFRKMASLNIARGCHGACAVGNAVIACGGWDGENAVRSCEIYLPPQSRWKFLPEMQESRSGVAVISVPDNRVFAIGGRNEKGVTLSSVEFCELPVDFPSSQLRLVSSSFWRQLEPMREARYEHAAAFLEGRIFVAGGWRRGNLSSVEMFPVDVSSGHWISLSTSMREKRSKLSLVVSFNGLFAFGNDLTPYNSAEQLLIETYDSEVSAAAISSRSEIFSFEWKSLPLVKSLNCIWGAIPIPKNVC